MINDQSQCGAGMILVASNCVCGGRRVVFYLIILSQFSCNFFPPSFSLTPVMKDGVCSVCSLSIVASLYLVTL
jgi:hypothetical protein